MVDNVDQSLGRLRGARSRRWASSTTPSSSSPATTAPRARATAHGSTPTSGDGQPAAPGDRADRRRSTPDSRVLDEIGGPQHLAALPAGLGDGLQHAVPALQDHDVPRRSQVPFVVSWPAPHRRGDADRARQYAHVTDVLPTLLDLIGRRRARRAATAGPPSRSTASRSPRRSRRRRAAAHTEQYSECVGNRGFYQDGWEAVTLHQPGTPFSDERVASSTTSPTDPTQLDDLADAAPRPGRGAGAALGGGRLGQPGLPPRRGLRHAHVCIRPGREAVLTRSRSRSCPARPRWSATGPASSSPAARSSWRSTGRTDAGDEGVLVAHGGVERATSSTSRTARSSSS